MDLFKMTMAEKSESEPGRKSLVTVRFGLPADLDDALASLEIGDPANTTPNRTVTVGLGSLLSGAAGVLAANGIVGWLSGAYETSPDILLNHLDAPGGMGAKTVFAACFVTHATIVEIGKRWFRRRGEQAQMDALSRGTIEAGKMGDGRWVVGPAGLFEGKAAGWSPSALALWANDKLVVLNESEFARFEDRAARRGCLLKKYRMEGEGRGVVTTLRSGKLHSENGEAAYKVMNNGKVVAEEWYRDGQRIPMPVPADTLTAADEAALKKSGAAEREEAALRAALDLMRGAQDSLGPNSVDGDRHEAVEARRLLMRADGILRKTFGEGFHPLYLDIDNVDGLINWPEDTARGFVDVAKSFLANSIEKVDERLIATESPEIAAFAEALKADLRRHEADGYVVSMSRFTDHDGIPAASITGTDDRAPLAQVVWSRDARFGKPGFGEVVGRAISWRESLSPEEVVEQVLGAPTALRAF